MTTPTTPKTPAPTTPTPCEDYSELCFYLTSNFNMDCFGDCDRYDPMDPNSLDVEDGWEECNGEVELTPR